YLVLAGTFHVSPFWAAVAVTGVVFGAVYLLMATRRVLFGPVTHEENRTLADLNAREVGLMLPLCACIVWLGVQPTPFLEKCAPGVERVVASVEGAGVSARAPQGELALPRSMIEESR